MRKKLEYAETTAKFEGREAGKDREMMLVRHHGTEKHMCPK